MSDTAIRKEAKKRGWQRPAAETQTREPSREPPANRFEATAKSIASTPVTALTARGRNIILALMDELEFLNRNHATIADMVEDYVNGDKDGAARAKLLKVLDHETRSKTANYLATALAKLNDAAPGKKQQADEEAKTAGQDSEWEDDLDFADARPN